MFTNEQLISDDDILPTDSTFFRGVRGSERPIPSFPRIREESNEHPTIDTETDPTRDANDDVSTTPRIDPTSFHIDGEITIALVHGDTSILLEDIVSMLPDTTASLDVPFSFFWNLPLAEVSISEKSIHFNDNVEFVNENMQVPKSWVLPSSVFQFTSDSDVAISSFQTSVCNINVVPNDNYGNYLCMSQYPDIDYPRRSVEEEKERLLQAFQGRHYEPPNQQKLRYSDKRHYHPPASNQDGEDDGQLDQFGVGNPKNVSSHILPGGLTPTVARLRQMESPDIDYKIQKLHGNMSMGVLSKEEYAAELRNQMREKWERERKEREQRKRGYSPQPTLEYFPFGRGGGGAPLRDENGRIVLAKDVLSGRQSAINNHPTHEQAQLSPPHVERIPRQDRQPHKEEPAIRQRAVPMEEREVVADAVESVTEYVPSARMKKLEEERKYRNELLEQAAVRKRLKAQEEARIREEERRMEEAARNYNPWGREGGGAPLKGRNGKLTGSLREVELKRKKEEMGNEEGDVDEMGGGVKERGRRGRGMGEESEGERSEGEREGVSGLRGMGGSSEIRKRQALEYREELRQQIEQKKREREEERRKAKQDEEAEEKRWKREQNELKKKGLEV
ncbi:putative centrosome and spindle pole-associated protein 1 [Blattamonas nauphoetae]|uniref:Centrosome and spindle pole-associated protein 1 n=1 Tax=Blattamonas nauphoetae TaxID=2049346 RepID=A0ABQ9YGX5_9EUKA|nr:putative centrosome and spindle pole-associated protein 1 [Blattamonas nauphoetae]